MRGRGGYSKQKGKKEYRHTMRCTGLVLTCTTTTIPVSYDSMLPCLNLKLACSVLVVLATRTRVKTAVMMCVGGLLVSSVVIIIVQGYVYYSGMQCGVI